MPRTLRLAPFVLLLAGCASGAGASSDGAPRLAWDRAPAEPVRYLVADTGAFTMNIPGMGEAPVDIQSSITLEMDFDRAAEGLNATANITDLSGTFASPAGAPVSADADDIPGAAQLSITPTGAVTIVERPAFSGALAQLTSPEALYRSVFIRLPGAAAARGASWTDTVRISESQSGMQSQITQVIRSTWVRDTVLDGRSIAVITSDISTQIELSGASQGVEIEQSLSGESNAVSLWDVAAGMLVERSEEGTASGTADLPGFQMSNIPVRARSRQIVRRLPG